MQQPPSHQSGGNTISGDRCTRLIFVNDKHKAQQPSSLNAGTGGLVPILIFVNNKDRCPQENHKLCVMMLCIQVLYIVNARIRIVQNFVDRPSASTSSASNRRVFVLLYKAFLRAKIYGKQGNPAIRFYKQRYVERHVILLFNIRNIIQRKQSRYRFLSLGCHAKHDHETSALINVGGKY